MNETVHERARAWAEVDLGVLSQNLRAFRARVGSGVGMLVSVKADAYGHGAVQVGRALAEAGVDLLGVASVDEAIELRQAGLSVPVMVLSSILPQEAPYVIQFDLTQVVGNHELARALDRAAERAGVRARVHVKVDTGMGRIGVAVQEAADFVRALTQYRHILLEGILTHVATADEEGADFAREQLALFRNLLGELERDGINIPFRHVACSAAVLRFAESHFNLVRPGLGIYGLYASRTVPRLEGLRPVMSLHTRIVFLKHVPVGTPISYGRTYRTPRAAVIATIPVGYGDGLLRALSNRMEVLIRGHRSKQVGVICMDQSMVDVTQVAEEAGAGLAIGERVTLIGHQGHEEIRAEELADKAQTIPYEIVTRLSDRVPRFYRSP